MGEYGIFYLKNSQRHTIKPPVQDGGLLIGTCKYDSALEHSGKEWL